MSSPKNGNGVRAETRGRPRDPAIDRAIYEAANALIAERGYAGVTIGEIAARAGVPKSTIYRRFGSREELLLASARETANQSSGHPDTGSLRGDLIELLRLQVEAFANRLGIAQLSLAAVNDSDLSAVLSSLATERRASTLRIIERAVDRGELPADVDADLVIDLVRGVGWARFLEKRPLDVALPEKVADYLLRGIGHTGG